MHEGGRSSVGSWRITNAHACSLSFGPCSEGKLRTTSVGELPLSSSEGAERLETSVEFSEAELPQSKVDDATLHRNLVIAFTACGYKCPVERCAYTLPPLVGMKTKLERVLRVLYQKRERA